MTEIDLWVIGEEDRYRFRMVTAVGGYEVSFVLTGEWRAQLSNLHVK